MLWRGQPPRGACSMRVTQRVPESNWANDEYCALHVGHPRQVHCPRCAQHRDVGMLCGSYGMTLQPLAAIVLRANNEARPLTWAAATSNFYRCRRLHPTVLVTS